MENSTIDNRTSSIAYLDPTTLASIHSLELRARMAVEGLMSGMHRSPLQGVSIEFAQHRQYSAGDDIRHLDWKVFGRTDKLYVKQYQKETNLDLAVLVDLSGSMDYSSRDDGWRKYDHAATIAATMAYLAQLQQDRVSLTTFSSSRLQGTRLSNTRDHLRSIVQLLTDAAPRVDEQAEHGPDEEHRGQTDLGRVIDEVIAKLQNRSLVVLVSDLFDGIESLERALARLYHRRHDLIVLQTLDHAERTFPFRAATDFVGLEGEGRIGLDPNALRKAYLESINAHLERVEETTRKFRFDYLLLDSSETIAAPLSHFLARRGAMLGRGK